MFECAIFIFVVCIISFKSVGKSHMKFVVVNFDGEAATASLSEPVHGPFSPSSDPENSHVLAALGRKIRNVGKRKH